MKEADGKKIYYGIRLDNTQLKQDAQQASDAIKGVADSSVVGSARIDSAFKGIGKTVAQLGIALSFAEAIRQVYKFAEAFDQSMREVSTLSEIVTANMSDFKAQILDMTTKIPVGADESAKALYQIVSAGHDGAAGMKILEESAKAAVGGVTETATAADTITTVLNAYKKDASEAENISDQLFTTVRLGKTTMGELGQSIAQAVPIAASFGIETEQVLAAVATLTKSGTPTAQAMTQIRAAIKAASVELGDGYFKTHTFQEGLAEIANRAGGSESKLRELVPEIEGMNAVLGLTGINANMAASDLVALGNSAGAAEAAFKKMNDGADQQLTILKNRILRSFAGIGDGMTSIAQNVAGFLNTAFESGAIKELSIAFAAAGTGLLAYKTILIAVNTYAEINNKIMERAVIIRAMAAKEGIAYSKAEAIAIARTKELTAGIRASTSAILAQAKALALNPYFWAAAAVAALAYGIYKLITAKSAEERAFESVNKTLDDYNEKQDELKSKAEESARVMQDDASTIYDKRKAYENLIAAYPELLKKYSEEEIKLMNLIELNKELGRIKGGREEDNIEQEYKKALDHYNAIKKQYDFAEGTNANKFSEYDRKNVFEDQLESASAQLDVWSKKLNKFRETKAKAEADNAPVEVKIATLDKNIEEVDAQIAELDKKIAEAKAKAAEGTIPIDTGSIGYLEFQKNGLEHTKGGYIKDKKALGNTTTTTKTQYDAELLAEQAKFREKISDEEIAWAKRQAEQRASSESAITQAVVDAMKDGTEKELAQLELNYSKQKDEITRKENEIREENYDYAKKRYDANPNNKDKAFSDTHKLTDEVYNLTKDQIAEIAALRESADIAYAKSRKELQYQEIEDMQNFLEDYGTYAQKKYAISQEYDNKIANASNDAQRKTLEMQKQSAIKNVDAQAISEKIDWQKVLGGMTSMLGDELENTLSQLKEYVKTDDFKQKDETDKKLIYDSIDRLSELSPTGNGTLNFAELTQQMKDLGFFIERLQVAQQNEINAYASLELAQKAYDNALQSGSEDNIAISKAALDLAQLHADNASATYNAAATDVQNASREVKGASTDTINGLDSVSSGLRGFASGTLQGTFKALQDTMNGLSKLNIGGKIGDAVGKFAQKISSAGFVGQLVSSILGILDALKDGIGQIISSVIDTVLGAVSGILNNILTGEMFVQIFDSLKNGITGIFDALTFGGFSSWFDSSNAKEVQAITDRLTHSNERLQSSIDNLKDTIDKSSGGNAISAYQESVNDAKLIIENQKEILKAQMGYHGAHHSNAYNWGLTAEEYSQINNLLGTKIQSLDDIYSLTPEQMSKIRTSLISVWDSMIDQGDYDKSEYWEKYADLADTIDDLTDKINENLIGTSFDSLRDGFLDTLMDMNSDAEDFSNDLSKMMQKAILNSKIGNTLDEQLSGWYDRLGEAMQGVDGELSEEQLNPFRAEYDQMIQDMLKLRDEASKITGYTGDDERSASSKGIASASQDSVDELNGRATAIQGHTYVISENIKMIQPDVSGIRSSIEMMRDCAVQQLQALYGIRDNTSRLETIENDMQTVKNTVFDIALKGLKMRQ